MHPVREQAPGAPPAMAASRFNARPRTPLSSSSVSILRASARQLANTYAPSTSAALRGRRGGGGLAQSAAGCMHGGARAAHGAAADATRRRPAEATARPSDARIVSPSALRAMVRPPARELRPAARSGFARRERSPLRQREESSPGLNS